MQAITDYVRSQLETKHRLLVESIVFCKLDAISKYRNGQNLLRYSLLDEYSNHDMQDLIVSVWKNEEMTSVPQSGPSPRCAACFSAERHFHYKPLTLLLSGYWMFP